jgi:hypothetical protein
MDESDRESWSFVDEDEAKGRASPAPSSDVSTVLTQSKMQTSPGYVPVPGHRGLQETLSHVAEHVFRPFVSAELCD